MTTAHALQPAREEARPPAVRDAVLRRYGEDFPEIGGSWNETLGVLLGHRSVRAFLSDPLPAGTVETIVAAAQSAPTSSNVQAWSVVAVEDRDRKARLAALAGGQKHIVDAPLILVFVADLSRHHDVAAERDLQLEGLDFTETFLIASIDAALAAQNAVVAAESLGFGTVYIGALRNHPADVAAEVGLPPRSYAVFGLVIGYPDPAVRAEVKPRLPQEAVLHREAYSREAQLDAIARHDHHTRAFRVNQGLDPSSWSDLVVARLRTVASLKGRHVLRDVLGRLGFPLR
ncbi:NADPH-dependent oxidoreductase [Aquamicrobium sp. LC103]|uniref:NADPH-dependent oxidoreductase n=1 Tax=Aquamicrobium sp. LC103 TaxID=1120658 RepID=UPI00063E9D79|nr:NADPH-dependent oxidoreductase [Aquamicrobium sp. LC103]TKT76312.1 NADPH-dependent oxidoreductase [Aquamicrobium sp. LC103]